MNHDPSMSSKSGESVVSVTVIDPLCVLVRSSTNLHKWRCCTVPFVPMFYSLTLLDCGMPGAILALACCIHTNSELHPLFINSTCVEHLIDGEKTVVNVEQATC